MPVTPSPTAMNITGTTASQTSLSAKPRNIARPHITMKLTSYMFSGTWYQ
jgi:hypothetical protein